MVKNSRSTDQVSVIITSYNQRQFLEASLDSIIQQTVGSLPIIVVDDGSTDGSVEYLARLAEDGKGVTFLRTNRVGVSAAINFALLGVRTPYVAFLAADDVALHSRLELQLNQISDSDEIVAVFGKAEIIDEFDNILPQCFSPFNCATVPDRTVDEQLLRGGNYLCASSALISMRAIWDAGPFHVGLQNLQDYEMWLRLSAVGKISVLDQTIVQYRMTSNIKQLSGTHNDNRMTAELSWIQANSPNPEGWSFNGDEDSVLAKILNLRAKENGLFNSRFEFYSALNLLRGVAFSFNQTVNALLQIMSEEIDFVGNEGRKNVILQLQQRWPWNVKLLNLE